MRKYLITLEQFIDVVAQENDVMHEQSACEELAVKIERILREDVLPLLSHSHRSA